MAPPSLFKMALRVTCRHINDIDDISNMPASIAMRIVRHVTSAQQLHTLELSNPEIADQTADLWRALIKRDMPNLKDEHMYEPRNPRSWHKVYKKIRREEDEREAAQEEALRQTLLGDKVKKAENQAVFVDKILSHARSGSSVFVDGVRKKSQGGWGSNPPSVQKAKNGTQAIAAIRRQAAQNSRQMSLAQPFKAMPAASRQIKQAPQSMLRELNQQGSLEFQPRELAPHQKEMLREHRKLQAYNRIVAPSRVPSAKQAEAERRNAAVVQETRRINEAKLRAFTERENAAAAKRPASKKFELEPAPVVVVAESTSRSSQPQSVTFSASPPAASSAASASPAKPISVSVSPPGTPPQKPMILKKRPAATNIFMTNKKAKR